MKLKTIVLLAAAALVGSVVTLGVTSTGHDGDGGDTTPATVGRITRMEQTGQMQAILEQHRAMLQQMQADASPAMLDLMNNDPMWKMLRSEEWSQLDAQHQADIDRMLGKGAP
ncbi:MAG TPA: hypothetical protein VHD87_02475 [Acidimicrobiales bacterium]|nr:hypothetical protein [Acidimicrobiales bacterium]